MKKKITLRKSYQVDQNDSGYILVLFLVVFAMAALAVTSSLQTTSSTIHNTEHLKNVSSTNYELESVIHKVNTWIRSNSENLVSIFNREAFYGSFDKSSSSVGSNDLIHANPTKLNLKEQLIL